MTAKTDCVHHFTGINRAGRLCVVCGRPISADMLADDRGNECLKCGFSVHVDCQHRAGGGERKRTTHEQGPISGISQHRKRPIAQIVAAFMGLVLIVVTGIWVFHFGGCGAMALGWGRITGISTAEQVKPYDVQGAGGVSFGVGRSQLAVFLPIADQMGTRLLSPSRFAELGGEVYNDARCSFAAAECKRLSDFQDPIFLIVSVQPKSEVDKWPAKYDLTIYDTQKGKHTYVAIQPLVPSSDSQCNEVGFCTRLEGVDAFSLLFVVPKTVAQSMLRAELTSVQGTCKWKKETKKRTSQRVVTIDVNGPSQYSFDHKTVDRRQLLDVIRDQYRSKRDCTVLIRAAANTRHKDVREAMDVCAFAGYRDFVLADAKDTVQSLDPQWFSGDSEGKKQFQMIQASVIDGDAPSTPVSRSTVIIFREGLVLDSKKISQQDLEAALEKRSRSTNSEGILVKCTADAPQEQLVWFLKASAAKGLPVPDLISL